MLGDRVFVYLKDEGTGLAFLRQAEAEGFSFGVRRKRGRADPG